MLRYLTNKEREARREANGKAVHAIYDRAKELIPADYLICHQAGAGQKPASGNLSFRRLGSRFMGPLPTDRREFKDSRGVPYTRDSKGTVHRVRKVL